MSSATKEKIMIKKNTLSNLKLKLDNSQLYRYQAPMKVNCATNCQFVCGAIEDGELWLNTDTPALSLAPISESSAKFRVYVMGEDADMCALVRLFYTATQRGVNLMVFSLQGFGIFRISQT